MIEQFGNGLLLGIIISVASVALSLLYGVTRIVNFAHGEIIALGAIMTLFFSNPIDSRVLFLDRYSPLGMNFTFSIIISIIICGIFGGIFGHASGFTEAARLQGRRQIGVPKYAKNMQK